MNPNTIGA